MTKTLLLLPILFLSISAAAQMRITEFTYDGTNKEWVEFTNVGATAIDMTGYSYDDDSRTAGTVSLSAFGTVQPGESVILAEATASDFRTAWNLCSEVKIIGNLTTNLGRADEINLFDASNTLVDRLTYGDNSGATTGSIRTQNKSGWVSAAGLGANNIFDWTLSSVGDTENSWTSTGGDIGSPGKSTRAPGGTPYDPCVTTTPGLPTIVLDVTNTSDYIDGGATTNLNTPYAIGASLNDSKDPAATLGISFTLSDDAVAAADLTLTASSSNNTVVPDANLVITGSGATRKLTITPAAIGYTDITLTVSNGANTAQFVINYAASSSTSTTANWLTGISDASAAIPLDDDYMVIGNDEDNHLYVFNRKASGLPATIFDFNQNNILALTDGSSNNWKEVDVEAAAPSPATTGKSYWLGSMSNSSSFNDKPNRDRIFAVTTTGTGAATTFTNAGSYTGLRQLLITWGDNNGYDFSTAAAAGKDPKTIDGFNAEGMTFAPDNTTLYIGFRAPLIPNANRTKAVIAPIRNFESWFNNGAPTGNPTIGAPIELDLGGRGIRDMIHLTNGLYVIIAGSYDGTLIPAAYRWTGIATDAPALMSSFDLTGINAEAALAVNQAGLLTSDQLQIIADDGDNAFYGDGVAAKDLSENNFKKFESTVIVSSDPVALPVSYEYFTAQRTNTGAALSWKIGSASDAKNFDVLRSTDGSNFSSIGSVAAVKNQAIYNYTDPATPATKVYYRIGATELSGATTYSTIRVLSATNAAATIRLYPNPITTNNFTISTDGQPANLDIYSSAGTRIAQYQLTGNAKDISTSGWAKGLYIAKITTESGITQTIKIIVE